MNKKKNERNQVADFSMFITLPNNHFFKGSQLGKQLW